jgi:hypothetical protein
MSDDPLFLPARPRDPSPIPTARELRDATFKADPDRADMLDRLITATPEQIDAYIEANVTNLAQARTFLKKLTKVLAIAVRE